MPLPQRAALLFVSTMLPALSVSGQDIGNYGNSPLPGARPRTPGQPQQTGIEMRRNMYLEGRVTLEDGTPPGAPVVIEMYCNGQNRPVGYSNLKGYFSFRPAENSAEVTGDASRSGVPGGPDGGPTGTLANDGFDDPLNISFGGLGGTTTHGSGAIDLTGCEVRASLPGFRASRLALGRRSISDSDLGTFILHAVDKSGGNSVSATSLRLPDKAHRMFEKAVREASKKKPDLDKAQGELENAVAKFPRFAAAWSLLGDLRLRTGDRRSARQAFGKAIAADPRYIPPYLPLIRLELAERNWGRAAQLAGKCRRLNPYLGEAGYYHAVASFNLGDAESAEKALEAFQASEDAGRFPQGFRMAAFLHARKGDYPKAASAMRAFLAYAPHSRHAEEVLGKLKEWEEMGVIVRRPATP